MIFPVPLFFLIIYVKEGHAISTDYHESMMAVDVIISFTTPTVVFVKVCWKPAYKINFAKALSTKNIKTISFSNKDEINGVDYREKDILIVADLSCPNIMNVFKHANATKKFRSPYRWLIIGKQFHVGNNIPKELEGFNILLDSEIIFTQYNGDIFKLIFLYKLQAHGNEWYTEPFGSWTPSKRLNKTLDDSVPSSMRRKNLGGMPITLSFVIIDNRTATELYDLRNIHIDTISKTCYRQISPLFDFMNATQVPIFSNTWGFFSNGSWSGMIGDLAEGRADLAGTVTFLIKQRTEVLEYLSQPSPVSVRFVFRQPPLSYENNLFLLPYKPAVWYCIFGLILIMIFVLYFNAKWENEKLDIDDYDQSFLKPSVSDIIIMIMGAMTQQGSSNELKGTLGRVVMFFIFSVFVFLYTSYSASIVALLQSTSDQIKTLSDLLNSKLELGVEDNPYNRFHFSTAKDPVRKEIYETKIVPRGSKGNYMSLEEGVKRLQTHPFAFHMNLGTGYRFVERHFQEHEKCGLQEIQFLQEALPWQTCRKNSPFTEIYKIGLFRTQEHGLNDRENRVVYAKKPTCASHGGSFGSVNMTDFHPALLMLLYGMILSCLLLVLEVLYYRRFSRISVRS